MSIPPWEAGHEPRRVHPAVGFAAGISLSDVQLCVGAVRERFGEGRRRRLGNVSARRRLVGLCRGPLNADVRRHKIQLTEPQLLMQSSTLYWLIIGCESCFWVVLFLGLAARYRLRRKRLSSILLLGLPVLDLALFGFTALDLGSGTQATFAHGLAAAYVGFTIAFGKVTVSWADQRVAHWFTDAPAPTKAPTRGWPALRYELRLWVRCLAAVAITLVLLVALIGFVDDKPATEALYEWFRIAIGCAIFWFIFGPMWTLLFSSWRHERDA